MNQYPLISYENFYLFGYRVIIRIFQYAAGNDGPFNGLFNSRHILY